MGRRDDERLSVGKRKNCHSKSQDEIKRPLVRLGSEGKRVGRLKSGDRHVYGRAAEERAALGEAGEPEDTIHPCSRNPYFFGQK